MLTGTVVFLVIGGIGSAVLALGLIGGQLLGLLNAGIDATAVSTAIGASAPGELAVSAAVGLAAAIPTTFLVARLSRAVRDMPTDDTPSRSDLLGARCGRYPDPGGGLRRGPDPTGRSPVQVQRPRGSTDRHPHHDFSDTSAIVIEAPGCTDRFIESSGGVRHGLSDRDRRRGSAGLPAGDVRALADQGRDVERGLHRRHQLHRSVRPEGRDGGVGVRPAGGAEAAGARPVQPADPRRDPGPRPTGNGAAAQVVEPE
jgi:hypothetical protein